MKKVIFIVFLVLSFACADSETRTVELSCGQCQFGLTSQDGCDLAVRFDDKAYFVDGANIDDFGDAADILEQAGGGFKVQNGEELAKVLVDHLQDKKKYFLLSLRKNFIIEFFKCFS